MRFFTVYKICVKTAVTQAAAYRFDFFLNLAMTFVGSLGFPLVALLIYGAGSGFPGWSFYEVLLIQSLFSLSHALARICLGDVLWTTMNHVRQGSYETVLLKPMDSLTYIIATTFSPSSFGQFLCGLALFTYAISQTGVPSIINIFAFFILFVAGVAVMAGIQLIMAAASFKWVGNSRLPEMFQSVEAFGQYPIDIFPNVINALITFVIPVGLVGFFPASALLGRVDTSTFIAVVPCALFFLLGVWLYKWMIRLYKGAGG